MEDHEGSVGLQMVNWIRRTVKRINGGHLELGGQGFVSDGGNKW